jgi:hypothetical protein
VDTEMIKALFLTVPLVLGWHAVAMANDSLGQSVHEELTYTQQALRTHPGTDRDDQRVYPENTELSLGNHGTGEVGHFFERDRSRNDSRAGNGRYNPYVLFRW